MVYFFHRYELPILLAFEEHQLNNNPPEDNSGNAAPQPARSVANQQPHSGTSNDSHNNQHSGEETNISNSPTTTAPNNHENQRNASELSVHLTEGFERNSNNLLIKCSIARKIFISLINRHSEPMKSKKYFCHQNVEILKNKVQSLRKKFKFNSSKTVKYKFNTKYILNVITYLIICLLIMYIVNITVNQSFQKLHCSIDFQKFTIRPRLVHS